MESAARAGERSIRRILAGKKIHSPRVPENLRKAFTNINTPDEWRDCWKSEV
jgi:molybdopterin-guanine dinucleotide biosynthesis protein A